MNNNTPICPKCGYDQSGEIATWEDQCPLEGRCPECGLGFAWADVLDPNRIELLWYVEHAKTKWDIVKRTIPTLWMLMIPNRYWRRLGMESPRSLKRYVLWIAMMMLGLHIVSSAAMLGAIHGLTLTQNAMYTKWMVGQTPQMQARVQAGIVDVSSLDYWSSVVGESVLHPAVFRAIYTDGVSSIGGMIAVICMGISMMWFVLFCMFPTTRARTKLRMVHVVRAMVVAGLLPFVIFEFARMAEALIYAGEYWAPLGNAERVLASVFVIVGFWVFIWMQWFWISAVWIGWKVKARWFEMIPVAMASFFGIVFAGVIRLILLVFGGAIDAIAAWAGI